MSTSKSVNRSIAVLNEPRPVGSLITLAQRIVTAMTGNPAFTSPVPTLANVLAAITDLQTAEQAALSRLKGAVTTRNDKRAALVTLLQELRAYVQNRADADPENSANLIESAAYSVRKTPKRAPRALTAKAGAVSGTVKLVTPSVGHYSFYEWAYSTDGGKTWTLVPTTPQAKTTITGLTPSTTVELRVRAGTKAGEGDWSQAVSLVVR
jgi:Fibronectin type III domain